MTRTLPQPGRNDLDILKVLHALADPVRLELLHTLSRETEPAVCSLDAYDVDVSAPTLSHHWRVLREAGLTTTFVNGRNRWVELRRDDLAARFPGLLESVLAGFEHRQNP